MRASDLSINRRPERVKPPAIRPGSFSEIIGQRHAVAQLELLCAAALGRGDVAPHVLIDGPPGLGKTTLAGAVAEMMQGPLWVTTGQSVGLEQLGKRLSTQPKGCVVFLDEVHTLPRQSEVMLLGALEDGIVDIQTQLGAERRTVKPFTLIGATTNPGDLSRPLKDRFGHVAQLTYYDTDDVIRIMERSAHALSVTLDEEAATDIAERAHGVPRIANRYLAQVRDYCQVHYDTTDTITGDQTATAFKFFDIDELGLSPRDREYVRVIHQRFRGGPVGAENMSVALGMDTKTVAADLEPLLMRLGLIARAPRGRQLTEDGRRYACELLGEDLA